MRLIKSISGIRGPTGGLVGGNLTPFNTVRLSTAFGVWAEENYWEENSQKDNKIKIIGGLDARAFDEMVNQLITATLSGLEIDVSDIGIATTPTVEIAVIEEKAAGGDYYNSQPQPCKLECIEPAEPAGRIPP